MAGLILIGPGGCASKAKPGISDEMQAEGHALFGTTSPDAQTDSDTPQATAANSSKPATKTSKTSTTARSASRASTSNTRAAAPATDSGWAIALEYVSGPEHETTSALRRAALARELGRQDISVRNRADGSVVVLGSYPSVADKAAQADLDWVRAFKRGNAVPFARAYLLPPQAEATGAMAHPEWDLAGSRSRPAGAGMELTLQVAVFDGGGNIQKARHDAEAFTEKLRASGEDAYFFHGPSLSVVTVGLFDAREADANGHPRSSGTRAAQRAHPLNLRDGTTPIVDARGASQESALMRIP